MRLPPVRTGLKTRLAAACLAALGTASCLFDSPPSIGSAPRRLYVNDQAVNDSLPGDLVRKGVKFVLQPGRKYELSIDGTARTADKLKLYHFENDEPSAYKTLTAASDGAQEVFYLESDRSTAQFFMARLLAPEGQGAVPHIPHVSLQSPATILSDTLHVRLLFIRKLRNLPDTASKVEFAESFFREMGAIYAPFKITLVGSYEIVEPKAPAMAFPFGNTFVSLPGKRVPNHAHLYLVDSISVVDPASGLKGEVLGFAPREVVDIDTHRESRVVISGRVRDPLSLAITAAHELGHFFGLRHTVSSLHDILQDDDESNVEDGFEDTRFCNLDIALGKRSAAPAAYGQGPAGPYCLRVQDNSCARTNGCDLDNLMHPVDCGTTNQTKLTPEQAAFLKKNLGSYKH